MKMAKQRFIWAKGTAKRRGIPFLLSFEEYYQWWLSNGVDKNVPRKYSKNSLVMCRYGDTGPYQIGNIFCDTVSNNSSCSKPGAGNRKGRIIETPLGEFLTIKMAAKAHNVSMATIHTWLKKKNDFNYK